MSFQQKNVIATLINFSLILAFYLIRITIMILNDNFLPENVFRTWGVVIVMAVIVTIFATILTHIMWAIVEAVRTQAEPEIEDVQDERDEIIDLRGTRITYTVSSVGSFAAMMTFVFGQPPLVMFCLLIAAGIVAQIAGDIARLRLYKRGLYG